MATGWKMSSEDAPRVIDSTLVVASYIFDDSSEHRSVKYWRYGENLRADLNGEIVWLRTARGTYWRESTQLDSDGSQQLHFVAAADIGIIRDHPVPELACLRSIGDFERLRIRRENRTPTSMTPSQLAGRDAITYDFPSARVIVDAAVGTVLGYEMRRAGHQRLTTTSFTTESAKEPISHFMLAGD